MSLPMNFVAVVRFQKEVGDLGALYTDHKGRLVVFWATGEVDDVSVWGNGHYYLKDFRGESEHSFLKIVSRSHRKGSEIRYQSNLNFKSSEGQQKIDLFHVKTFIDVLSTISEQVGLTPPKNQDFWVKSLNTCLKESGSTYLLEYVPKYLQEQIEERLLNVQVGFLRREYLHPTEIEAYGQDSSDDPRIKLESGEVVLSGAWLCVEHKDVIVFQVSTMTKYPELSMSGRGEVGITAGEHSIRKHPTSTDFSFIRWVGELPGDHWHTACETGKDVITITLFRVDVPQSGYPDTLLGQSLFGALHAS